jgi:hypothetical protein
MRPKNTVVVFNHDSSSPVAAWTITHTNMARHEGDRTMLRGQSGEKHGYMTYFGRANGLPNSF